MSISKFKIAVKWVFGGPEAVIDYVLSVLNSFIGSGATAEKVKSGVKVAETVLDYLNRYEDWCPAKWKNEYDAVRMAVMSIVSAAKDATITKDEIEGITATFKSAYAKWSED